MSAGRGQVHLGDLVRAIVALEVTEVDTAMEIARALGLSATTDSVRPVGTSARTPPPAADPDEPRGTRDDSPAVVSAPVPPPREADGGCSLLVLREPRPASGRVVADESDGVDVQRLLDSGSRDGAPEPVWSGRWASGVMFAATATDVIGRVLDERALVRGVADRGLVRTLPFRSRPTTRLGIQLLLDGGESMRPFRFDQRWLRELADAVVGRGRVEVLRFQGTPWRGVRAVGRRGPVAYRAPAAGTPVVLVSDLGLRRLPFSAAAAAGSAEWRDWIDGVRRAGCPVVCLTPYEARAHPWALRRRVAMVPLDRRTSIRAARRETRRAGEGVRR
ncbi:hypothetical protein OG948_27945 [Embleya sp. NBC_00888]|uniref:hypothetical protein n=1 Tax=Embleya sp. NBC_00888 TaxID=2975960 RepID=UPI00386C4E98|nr:hypothetical protein OG948_27945 [Embleya sp. NBC_00888]